MLKCILAVVILAVAQPVWAGIYNTADKPDETQLSPDMRKFSGVLGDLRTIALAKSDRNPPLRIRYILMETLGRKGAAELKSLEQQLDYSTVLIRRGKADEAIQLLRPLTDKDPNNFLVWSHLATAYHLSGNKEFGNQAGDSMREALRLWPKRWDDVELQRKVDLERTGWDQGTFDWYRKCEDHFNLFLKLRRKPQTTLALDSLFTDAAKKPVRFVDEAGKYAPGRIPGTERDKLPDDAIEIVEQLLVWMPNDIALYWLLAELLNARAMNLEAPAAKYHSIRDAGQIMKELVTGLRDAGGRSAVPDELLDHYDALQQFLKANAAMEQPAMPKDLAEIVKKPIDDDDDSPLTREQWWRALIVGFVTGLAVGLFALWQVQEMRRRRQGRD